MKPGKIAALIGLMFLFTPCLSIGLRADSTHGSSLFDWKKLAPLPRGLGGQFAAEVGGRLYVAGGSYWSAPQWENGVKTYVSDIVVLEDETGQWRKAGSLPRPLAYGVTVPLDDGFICAGGSDGTAALAVVYRVKILDGAVSVARLPDLPAPRVYHAGARVNNRIIVVGGSTHPVDLSPTGTLWAMDLDNVDLGWKTIPAPPGMRPTCYAQATAVGDDFYLFGGKSFTGLEEGKGIEFIRDGYRYSVDADWEKLSPLPVPLAAGSMVPLKNSTLLIFCGDDGALVKRAKELKDRHPGFPKKVYSYNTISGQWTVAADMPASIVTTTPVWWKGGMVLPGGEDKPGHRTPEVWMAVPRVSTSNFGFLNHLVMALYFIVLLIMGAYLSKREKSTDDFFLAGKRVPGWAAGLSAFGTQLSAITYMAIPAKTYATDWVFFTINMTIICTIPVVTHYFIPIYRKLSLTTVYEYLGLRFSPALRFIGVAGFLLMQVARMGVVILLPSLALTQVMGFPISWAIALTAVVSTAYTVMGGIEAVIWTDVLQVIVLLGGAILSIALIVNWVPGGFMGIVHIGMKADKFRMAVPGWDVTTTALWLMILGPFFNNLIPWGSDQAVVQRYFTTPDEAQAKNSAWLGAAMSVLTTPIFFFIGTALFAYYTTHPGSLVPGLNTDMIFPHFIVNELPGGVAGMVIAGIFAAAMSTLDSSLNSVATVCVHDIYRRIVKSAPEEHYLRAARALTVFFGLVSMVMAFALINVQSAWDAFLAMLGLFGSSLAGLFVLGIFSKRATARGALVGVIASVIVLTAVKTQTNVHFLLYSFIGIASCYIFGVFASLFPGGMRKDMGGLTAFQR